MSTQLHLANGLVEGRAYTSTDRALVRDLELARRAQRKEQRKARATRARVR